MANVVRTDTLFEEKGDLNCDGAVDMKDMFIMNAMITESKGVICPQGMDRIVDMNFDGILDVKDTLLLSRLMM